MNRILILALCIGVWSAGLTVIAYNMGTRNQANADKADQLAVAENDAEILRIKNRAAAAAGMRTEIAQVKTNTVFVKIRSDYEAEQRRDPSIGCVLDPVSLRLWNAANIQSDSATPAASESAAGLRDAADLAAWTKRSE
ncbi:MAG: hypothetical protein GZ090_01495 [Oxalobacteraceae bacterium]|nr:hypothetical protein [Oxalobacteraceae bacterium]